MKQISILLALTAVLLVAGCAPPAPNPDQMIAAAKELDQKWLEAFNAQDLDAVMDTYLNSPDVVSFPVGGDVVVKGWDALKAKMATEFSQMKGAKLTVSDLHYEVGGNLVVSWGLWHMSMPMPDGTTMEFDGRYSDVKKEHNGKWVFIMDHPSMPFPPPPTAPM